MDVEFLDGWMTAALTSTPHYESIFTSLATVLSRTPSLSSLRIRVAENSGTRSAWRRFALSKATGLPFGPAFQEALQNGGIGSFALPMLHTLEMDGFEDISPILQLTPNLASLRLCLSAGFAQGSNLEFLEALKLVPNLRRLAYTPESLRLHGWTGVRDDDFAFPEHGGIDMELEHVEVPESSVEFIKALGQALPRLESLDLFSRYFGGNDIFFCASAKSMEVEVSQSIFIHICDHDAYIS